MENIIEVCGLTKKYASKTAVDNVGFQVTKGEIFGLLGHNGAGKSTTIECILGIKEPDQGEVKILGMNPRKQRKLLFETVGVQLQQPSYQEKIKVKEICELTYSLYHNPLEWEPLLITFGLSKMKDSLVSDLSGGERQKLSVLLALMPNPELVFLDELTTGLASKARRDVWKHLEYLKAKGLTVFLTSHYMDEIQALCDRICILKNGQTVIIDTVEEIISKSPYDNLEQAYLWYCGEDGEPYESI